MMNLLLVSMLAFLLGIAIQRGTTCAVLAVEELMRHRRTDRFIGFFECGLWASLTTYALGGAGGHPAWSGWTMVLVGTALFGTGAAVNGACAFGTVARLGNGRLEYLLTFAGAFLGIRLIAATGWSAAPSGSASPNEDTVVTAILGLLIAAMLLRWVMRRRILRSFVSLGAIMAAIGILGAILGSLHQPWPWMTAIGVLPDVETVVPVALTALVAGSVVNGLAQRRFRLAAPSIGAMLARTGGGALMGCGAALVPGGNDAFILQGIPAGEPRAIVGYLVMLAVIAVCLHLIGGISPRWRKPVN